jgi:hypothetical protein
MYLLRLILPCSGTVLTAGMLRLTLGKAQCQLTI